MRRLFPLFFFLLALVPTSAQAVDCQFILGFATLRDLIGHEIVGDCLENEYWNEIGDSNQRTTGGLMAWRKADNWTAFTDGYRTWINGPNGLVQRLNTERFEWEADYAEIVLGVRPTPVPGVRIVPTPTPKPAPVPASSELQLATGTLGTTVENAASIEHVVVSPHNGVGVAVVAMVPDATQFILATEQFNDVPDAGNRYYLLAVTILNSGDEEVWVSYFDFKLVGDRRVIYDSSDGCGGFIDDELSVELLPDGIGSGRICLEVPQKEGGFVLIYEPSFSFDKSQRRFIRLPETCPNREVIGGSEFCVPNYIAHGR